MKIKNTDLIFDVLGYKPVFPKYTTQIMNLANQNAQGTRPKVVGQLSNLIQEFPGSKYNEWVEWYLLTNPNAIENASEKVYDMVFKLKEAIELIDKKLIRKWVEDLVITKTYVGLRFQESILKKLSELSNLEYRLANPDEESKGVDARYETWLKLPEAF